MWNKLRAIALNVWQFLTRELWQNVPEKPLEAISHSRPGDALSPNTIHLFASQLATTLPANLIQAFSPEPLAAGDVRFVGREQLLASVQQSLNQWRHQRGSLTALVGPKGSGLSSTLNQITTLLTEQEQFTLVGLAQRPHSEAEAITLVNSLFHFDPCPESVPAMISAINALPARVLLVDDAHMLLARSPGNLQAVQTVGAILVATQNRHCWIVACQEQAWRRLDYVFATARFFSRVLTLAYFDDDEWLEVIARRFNGLGYRWKTDSQQKEQDWLNHMASQLRQVSGGLPELGFFFLQHALRPTGNEIALAPLCSLDTDVLKGCDDDELFSLAEILVHGIMTHMEHETLFRISSEQCLLRLERLARAGILLRKPTSEHFTSNSYCIAPFLAQALVAHLVNRNRLY